MLMNVQTNVSIPQNNINFKADVKVLQKVYPVLDRIAFEMPLDAATRAEMSAKQNNNNYFKLLFSYLRQIFCMKTDMNAEVLDKACFEMPLNARKKHPNI